MTFRTAFLTVILAGGIPAMASAQEPAGKGPSGRVSLDASGGYAAFVDESAIEHFTLGGALRWHLSPRVSLGPEVVFMQGPGGDRDVFVTAKIVTDLLPRRTVSPYVVADFGAMTHRDEFFNGPYWSNEMAASGGLGVRMTVAPGVTLAPEVRIGWEPHIRIGAVLSWRK